MIVGKLSNLLEPFFSSIRIISIPSSVKRVKLIDISKVLRKTSPIYQALSKYFLSISIKI